ncbi:hypothetical protein C900_05083 [Fulvivirga imtechensis AK7]|uniref:DUF58 domain-containing protein n=1 Tax=Fulvivirga imtechensis AK7 TaxID=1237149 RepID=L8JME8_9BACT|nr:DUF58 domain-containing protein [Fulvivirga imtechensis]ELR69393.1 hypothetical protein C900_05083 [Fulvivirga imtechensis AK7]
MKLNLDQVKDIGNIDFLARQLVEGFITGLHKSPYHGFSVEFAEHQLYNTGESTRHIDWKVYAKTDRLYTKRYEEETNLRCQIVIDNSSSMHYPQNIKGKLTFSILSAAAIAYLLQKQRDAVGITTFSDQIETTTPIKSTGTHLNKLFIQLEHLYKQEDKHKRTAVANILHEVAEKNHKRSLIIIFSDMFDNEDELDEIFKALQHLKHNKHEVLLFHVTDMATEYDFNFEDRPYEFIDLESGQKLKLQPHEVKENYTQQIKKYYQELKLRCGQLKIDFIEADISADYNEVLNAYLIKRSKMR